MRRCPSGARNPPAGLTLHGAANVLVLPNLDAANILFNVLKVSSGTTSPWAPSCWARRTGPHPDALGPCAAWST
jgi:hypothetical protein